MTADSINSLKTEREALTGQLCRFKEFIDEFKADKKTVAILSNRLLAASSLLHLFHRVQTKIEVIQKFTEPKDRAVFEEQYYEILARAQLILNTIGEEKRDIIPFDYKENIVPCIKHPDPYIDHYGFATNNSWNKFSGHQDISNNRMFFNKKSKLNELKSCLDLDDIQLIRSISARENYNKTSMLFMKKQKADRSLVNGHIKAIYDMSPMENGSYSSMKNLYSSLKEHVDALKSLGEDIDSWNILIINIIEQKLDYVTKEDWKKISTNEKPSLDGFIKYLADRCRYFELQNTSNQDNKSIYFEEYNEKSNLLTSSSKCSTQSAVKSKLDYGSKEKKESDDEKNSDSEEDSKKKKDKKKLKKQVQGGVVKVCMYGLQSFITSISKKMFKVLAKSVFKFFVKAYLKWQVVTPMSIQLV